MNTPVNFTTAKLLKEKGYRILPEFESSYPTIAEVIMWLYEKHGIWIYAYPVQPLVFNDENYPKTVWVVKCLSMNQIMFEKFIDTNNGLAINHHNSPTEAYEAAIEYVLMKT